MSPVLRPFVFVLAAALGSEIFVVTNLSLLLAYQIVITKLLLPNCHLTKLSLPNCHYQIVITKLSLPN